MKTLLELLDEFRLEMIEKFVKRIAKHPGNQSVTDESFDWRNQDLDEIEHHLLQEFFERFPKLSRLYPDKVASGITYDSPEEEDVDIGAVAFVDWAIRRVRSH